MRRAPLFVCLAVVPVLLFRLSVSSDPLPGFPNLMLWAWESPQDLRFVRPGSAGIAFLARTVWLSPQAVRSRPRLQPLRFIPGTPLMAVVRLESAGRGLPAHEDVIREVLPLTEITGLRAVQIDFDARRSERSWYADFLRAFRQALPPNLPLSITALESWCEEDGWIRNLPVAEAIPMLFRMGPEDHPGPASFPARICRSSIGASTDELPVRIPRTRRLYFFHPGPWTQETYDAAVAQAQRWRK